MTEISRARPDLEMEFPSRAELSDEWDWVSSEIRNTTFGEVTVTFVIHNAVVKRVTRTVSSTHLGQRVGETSDSPTKKNRP